MATIHKYTNALDIEITEQQKKQLKDFKVIFEIDEEVKRIEEFVNKELATINYYIDPTETEAEVLDLLRNEQPNCNCFTIFEKESFGEYIIEYERRYFEAEESPMELRSLYNVNGDIICAENTTFGNLFLIDDSHQDYSVRKKYFYNEWIYSQFTGVDGVPDSPNFMVFEAYYKPDGSLSHVVYGYSGTDDYRTFLAHQYSELVSLCNLNATEEAYYLTDTFLPA